MSRRPIEMPCESVTFSVADGKLVAIIIPRDDDHPTEWRSTGPLPPSARGKTGMINRKVFERRCRGGSVKDAEPDTERGGWRCPASSWASAIYQRTRRPPLAKAAPVAMADEEHVDRMLEGVARLTSTKSTR
jgi:hypothetical protein